MLVLNDRTRLTELGDIVNSAEYACKEKPGHLVVIFVEEDAEIPASITIRYPDEDYKEYRFWYRNEN